MDTLSTPCPVLGIAMTGGGIALVDAADFVELNRRRWSDRTGYPQSMGQSMHQVLVPTPPDRVVDHVNAHKKDNRRCNLEVVTFSENNRRSHITRKQPLICVLCAALPNEDWTYYNRNTRLCLACMIAVTAHWSVEDHRRCGTPRCWPAGYLTALEREHAGLLQAVEEERQEREQLRRVLGLGLEALCAAIGPEARRALARLLNPP